MIRTSTIRGILSKHSVTASSRSAPSRLSFCCPRRFASALSSNTKDTVLELSETLARKRQRLLEQQSSPDGSDDIERSKFLKELEPIHRKWIEWKEKEKELKTSESLASNDPDEGMRTLAEEEISNLQEDLTSIRDSMKNLLLPPDPLDSNGAILELRPGVGGNESALFTSEVSRMYIRFAQSQPWQSLMGSSDSPSRPSAPWEVEMLSSTPIEVTTATSGGGDGLKEAIIQVKGENAFKFLRYEAGVHRVQRIPATQNLGKLQSSTIAVVVLPLSNKDEKDQEKKDDLVDPKDVKIEVMRSRGAGGQHVNKTESAIRMTHEPTGITVSMQDSRSQHQNRTKAWAILRARLEDRRMREEVSSNRAVRQAQVAGMERGDRIRTYNFPQDRITDHRISLSLTGIQSFLEGDDDDSTALGYMISKLRDHFDEKRLESELLRELEEEEGNGNEGRDGGSGRKEKGKKK